jgi:hypothetical protein
VKSLGAGNIQITVINKFSKNISNRDAEARREQNIFPILPKRREDYTVLEPKHFHLDSSPCENLEFCEENMLGFEVNRNFKYLEDLRKQFFN